MIKWIVLGLGFIIDSIIVGIWYIFYFIVVGIKKLKGVLE